MLCFLRATQFHVKINLCTKTKDLIRLSLQKKDFNVMVSYITQHATVYWRERETHSLFYHISTSRWAKFQIYNYVTHVIKKTPHRTFVSTDTKICTLYVVNAIYDNVHVLKFHVHRGIAYYIVERKYSNDSKVTYTRVKYVYGISSHVLCLFLYARETKLVDCVYILLFFKFT